MNSQRPKFPYITITLISVFLSIILTGQLSHSILTSMLDFLGLITPILFTAFGIWIGIIDPSKILFQSSKESVEAEDSIIYQLCYYLMCCTFVLIVVISLKFIFFTYPSWKELLSLFPIKINDKILITLKYIASALVTFLYFSILWISFAILAPLIRTMTSYKEKEQSDRILWRDK